MKGLRRWWCGAAALSALLWTATSWGYFFDERREMSLSGFAYSRATIATADDDIGTGKSLWEEGNLVQHRNFLTLEWRHNIDRISRNFPTIGPAFQFLNLDSFDYYLNFREEYDGVTDYGPQRLQKQLDGGGGTNYWDKYYGRQKEAYPGEFTRFHNFEYLTSIQWMEKNVNRTRLFEWYFNITKGPLFIRIGRQNLSWGETDSFRLLDQINPLDNLFGGFLLPLDERRVPLNMLRAQWSFGTVGPISDLTLEGFVSPDYRTAAWYTLNQGSIWQAHTNTSPVAVGRMPCGGPVFGRKNPGPNDAPGNGVPCSVRAPGPHSSIEDSRGGGRLVGTIHDFTFSLAHYYTWSDNIKSEAAIHSPSPEHLAWDTNPTLFTQLTGKTATRENNPWGSNDPVIGASGRAGDPGGGFGTPAVVERNIWVPIVSKRVQISGGSLSFPVNALTGMFVGSDNPLYYIYTTFRSEFAYLRNVPVRSDFHDGQTIGAVQRFMTVPMHNAGVTSGAFYNPVFLPGGSFSSEGTCLREDGLGVRGCRRGRMKNSDAWAFSIGLDHNQWIRFLNPNNSFTFSAQIFMTRYLNGRNTFRSNKPAGFTNDRSATTVRPRSAAPIGPNRTDPKLVNRPGGPGNRSQGCIPVSGTNPPCQFKGLTAFPLDQELNTLSISTQYMGGNLRPSFVFFYDWAGAYLLQPGVDWTFWDPFRVSLRYNMIEGRYTGIGVFKAKDTAWVELQYLLY